jgi:hypothetical protein
MRNDKGHFVKGHSGFRNSKYSDLEIIQEGEKYDSPSDFIKNNKTLYTYATKRGLTKKIKYKKGYLINYYTDEELICEGEKYDNPTEFIKKIKESRRIGELPVELGIKFDLFLETIFI